MREKAALFVDNSNIFKGMQFHSKQLRKEGNLKEGQFIRIQWDRLMEMLEQQDDGIDIFARHFFASLPPAADVSKLRERPTEEKWEQMVKKSAQRGFYKVIQNPPFSFTLHAVPLKFAMVHCRNKIRGAYHRCLDVQDGKIKCSLQLSMDECFKCKHKFLFKYEKGVDVALSAQMILFVTRSNTYLNRVILVAGDGDYKEAARFIRQEIGKDLQIVSWKRALSRDLEKLANKKTIILDDHWKTLCEVKSRPPTEEAPAADEDPSADE